MGQAPSPGNPSCELYSTSRGIAMTEAVPRTTQVNTMVKGGERVENWGSHLIWSKFSYKRQTVSRFFPFHNHLKPLHPFLLHRYYTKKDETLLSIESMNSGRNSKLETSWHSVVCFFRKIIVSRHENDPSSHLDQYHNPRLPAMLVQQSQ